MSDHSRLPIVVLMTASDHNEASKIAEMLVSSRLAACVQLLPEIESIYRWQGAVERSKETLLLAKTTSDRFKALEAAVREIHTYDTPEIVALPMNEVSAPYLAWLLED